MIAICTMIRGCLPPIGDSANFKTPPVSYRCHPPRRGGQTDARNSHKTKGSLPEGEETFGFFKEFFEFFELSRSDAEKFALRICSMEFALQIPLRVFSARKETKFL